MRRLVFAVAIALFGAQCAKTAAPARSGAAASREPPTAVEKAVAVQEPSEEQEAKPPEEISQFSAELKGAALRMTAFRQAYSRSLAYKAETKKRFCDQEEDGFLRAIDSLSHPISEISGLLSGNEAPRKEQLERRLQQISGLTKDAEQALQNLFACQRLELKILGAQGEVLFQTRGYARETKSLP